MTEKDCGRLLNIKIFFLANVGRFDFFLGFASCLSAMAKKKKIVSLDNQQTKLSIKYLKRLQSWIRNEAC